MDPVTESLVSRIEAAEERAAAAEARSGEARQEAAAARAQCHRAERKLRLAAGLASLVAVTVLWGAPGTRAVAQGYGATLQQILSRLTAVEGKTQYVSVYGTSMVISGANLQILNGSGSTDQVNGLGNLILGYNKPRTGANERTGSHNLVVGDENDFSSYGGVVAGLHNTLSGAWSAVAGGTGNSATNLYSAVTGGQNNTASGQYACVSGGYNNLANGYCGYAAGGDSAVASGNFSGVFGGESNTASGNNSGVFGGQSNATTRFYAVVAGGLNNTAGGYGAFASGGEFNVSSGYASTLTGGFRVFQPNTDGFAAGGSYPYPSTGPGVLHVP
ncbi:MAG TPA: hypothetical protein VGN26_18305 [Armatimonadota bacterium]